MGAGLLMGATTIKAAWPLTFRLCDWHHGFFMIAIGFTVFGYGLGKWAALKMVRNYLYERNK
jgi:hypothetical protein